MAPKRQSTGGAGASTSAAKKPKTESSSTTANRLSTSFKAGKGPASAATAKKAAGKPPVKVEKQAAPVSSSAKDGPTMSINDPSYDAHHKAVKIMMGGKAAIHGDENGLTRIDDILRLFDLTYKYGPASGMSRLERWNRAEELGMDPPVEVKDILLTREGIGQQRYREAFTYGTGV